MEVCERFRMTIPDYQSLPTGERILYDQYALFKLQEAAKTPVLKFGK